MNQLDSEMVRRYHAHDQLLAQNKALRQSNERLLEACKIASGAETMTLKLKRILLDAIAAAEQEQEH